MRSSFSIKKKEKQIFLIGFIHSALESMLFRFKTRTNICQSSIFIVHSISPLFFHKIILKKSLAINLLLLGCQWIPVLLLNYSFYRFFNRKLLKNYCSFLAKRCNTCSNLFAVVLLNWFYVVFKINKYFSYSLFVFVLNSSASRCDSLASVTSSIWPEKHIKSWYLFKEHPCSGKS